MDRHGHIYASGDCEIDLARRELRVLGSPVPVGGRAFEIIEVLARAAGELVTKDELMHRIWPGAIVMEGTLHVHAAAVRKALGPYRGLLKTESRRGYRLIGDWTVRCQGAPKLPAAPKQIRMAEKAPANNFPTPGTHLIGRTQAIENLRDLASAYRVVTLTGPGGIGKTTLALKLASSVLARFADGGWFVELASLSNPDLVPSAVAATLGLRLGSDTLSPEAVARAIAGKRLLLVLDNCEHVIGAAATLAETCVHLCPRIMVLTTSREVFRIEGEFAYHVQPLEVPAPHSRDTDQILACSAPELFIARARELGSNFSPSPDTLPTIAAICRHLDGIPLAIEFAAARAATLGVEQVAQGLRDRFALLTSGRRTALPRHQTLRAVLDWSYGLLTDRERTLLLRLSVFSGSFSLAAVNAVANRDAASDADIADLVASLVAKSLVTSDVAGGTCWFRLLETTRVYALSRLAESGQLAEFSQRHAEYYRGLLRSIQDDEEKRSLPIAHIDNVRAALEWCFGANGYPAIGVGVAAVAAPVFLAMSLFPECHRWSLRALSVLDEASRGSAEEMQLQTSLGISSMQMHGQSDAVHMALSRGLAIAEARADALNQVALLGMLSMFHVRDGDFRTSLHYARRSRGVEGSAELPAAMALAHSILGRALQFVGEHDASREELEASFRYWSGSPSTGGIYLGLDHQILVGIGLARSLWLRGYPAQAMERARETIKEAESKNHPASLGLALSWAPGLFLWIGDVRSAAEHTDWLLSHARSHLLGPYLAVWRGYQGALAIRQGDPERGVESLRCCLKQLHAMRYEMLNAGFRLALVEGLAAIGKAEEAVAVADRTIGLIETNGDVLHMPEALRVTGKVLLCMPRPRAEAAERCFVQSLGWSRGQGARAWELRTAIDLAALWADQGQRERGRAVLEPVVSAFAEGFDTADLRAARHRLATLG